RLVARLVGGELRGRARGRRSLEETRRGVGEDPEERAPSRISRRDRRSRPAVPELGEIVHTLTGGGRFACCYFWQRACVTFAPANANLPRTARPRSSIRA